MDVNQKNWTCTECGYTSSEKFPDDICPRCNLTYWRCAECGFIVVATKSPAVCPECKDACNFTNLTCYIPDWEATELLPWHDRQEVLGEV